MGVVECRPKGFAFVEMESTEISAIAKERLNGSTVRNRQVGVILFRGSRRQKVAAQMHRLTQTQNTAVVSVLFAPPHSSHAQCEKTLCF